MEWCPRFPSMNVGTTGHPFRCEQQLTVGVHRSNPPPPKSAADFADLFRRFVGFLNSADFFCQFVGFL